MGFDGEDGRPALPADLRRRVLVEAGHRCAIPTCRHIEVDVHHIIPWAQCQTHEYENLIALCPNDHRRADRGEIDRKALRLYKFNLRFAHDKFSQIEIDVLLQTYQLAEDQALQWPPIFQLLIARLLQAGYVAVSPNPAGKMISMGMQLSPDFLIITPKGRSFVDELGIHLL